MYITITCTHSAPNKDQNKYTAHVSYFLEFFLPLYFSRTHYLARAERNITHPWIVLAHACAPLSWWVWLNVQLFDRTSSVSMCSETCWNHYLQLLYCTVQLNWVDLSWSAADFTFIRAKSARSAVRILAWKCCNINCSRPCFVPTLELYLQVSTL